MLTQTKPNTKMKHYLRIMIIAAYTILLPNCIYAIENRQVISQMNYCINSLTRLINASSVEEIDHEINQILNNLTMEQIEGMDEINLFRNSLYNNAADAQITQEERNIRKMHQQMRRDQTKWSALSSALDNVMMLIPGYGMGTNIGNGGGKAMIAQMAFYGVITMVRSGVDYMNISKNNDMMDQAELWALKKRDMETWKTLRSSAQDIVYKLYNKYHLKEYDRLTEETSNLYYQITKEPNPERRIRQLRDNKNLFENLYDYYYYLGVSYYELKDYINAEENFRLYENNYKSLQLFRHDEKSGLIALYRLQYSADLSFEDQAMLINTVINNLPNNGMAYLTCALAMLNGGHKDFAASVLRRALDNPNISNVNELLLGALKLLPLLSEESNKDLLVSISNYKNNYFIIGAVSDIYKDKKINWEFWNTSFIFNNYSSSSWYSLGLGHKHFNYNFEVSTPGRLLPENGTRIYVFEKKDKQSKLVELDWKYKYGVSQSQILKKVKLLSEHPELITTFFDVVIPDSIYFVKNNINFEKLKQCDESYPLVQQIRIKLPQMSFTYDNQSADSGIKKVVKNNRKQIEELSDFLEKNRNKSADRDIIQCNKPDVDETDVHYFVSKSLITPKRLLLKYAKQKMEGISKYVEFQGSNFIFSPIFEIIEDGIYVLFCRNSILDFTTILKYNDESNKMDIFAITLYQTTYFRTPQKYLVPRLIPKKNDSTLIQKEDKKDDGNWYDGIVEATKPIWAIFEIKSTETKDKSNSKSDKNSNDKIKTNNESQKSDKKSFDEDNTHWYDGAVKWSKDRWNEYFGDDKGKKKDDNNNIKK